MNFTNSLIVWYLRYKRNLPWRDTNDPYPIWLSEIILQQTRVAQGMPYYFAFLEAFPTVQDLAAASEEQVLKLWQGLGYYSRARNLHKTARIVAFELGGKFPDNFKDLLQLKGVGEYTAAAIASFAFDEAVPVVDGNVFRVLSRYFDIETDIAEAPAKKEFFALALELMPKDNPAVFNQAIMEFGALQCVPRNPDCGVCPLNAGCLALKLKKVNQLPVKSKKVKVRTRFLNYLVVADANGHSVIRKRTEKGIWHNLYEFPLFETAALAEPQAVLEKAGSLFPEVISIAERKNVNHKLSHQNLHVTFWHVEVAGAVAGGIDAVAMRAFPFPVVIYNFIANDWH